jgi:ABC-type glycerol-3-phosphate transport system substrate-binding protein
MRTRGAVLLATLVLAAACGGDDDGSSADAAIDPCPLEGLDAADAPVALSIEWAGGWDRAGTTARIESFDTAQPAIDVTTPDVPIGFFRQPLNLLGDAPSVLTEVSYVMVPALAEAGAISPIGDCVADAGVDVDDLLPAAAAKGAYDGRVFGVSTNIDTTLLLYDRAAFRRAGLDPDVPPRTLDEVLQAGLALRDVAGIERPIAWDAPQLALLGLDIGSDDARQAASTWVAFAHAGLLLTDNQTDLPPVGSGLAAMQWVDPGMLWGYASAIADGQAPDADLGVAPLPGVREAVAPVGGGVWVVSASATPAQRAAAARFLAWYGEPAQESVFHVATDMYPSSVAGGRDPSVIEYWQRHPLIGAGWDAIVERPLALDGWERILGTYATIIPFLNEVANEEATFEEQWPRIVRTIEALEETQRADPDGLLRCLAEHIEDPVTPAERCAGLVP